MRGLSAGIIIGDASVGHRYARYAIDGAEPYPYTFGDRQADPPMPGQPSRGRASPFPNNLTGSSLIQIDSDFPSTFKNIYIYFQINL